MVPINGAFTALQIMRCAANIYFFKPENVEFTKDKGKQNAREVIEHMLSSNYVLRYSEITFGNDSNIFKLLLKEAIEDKHKSFSLIENLATSQGVKDYLKCSRKLILNHYVKVYTKILKSEFS